MNEWMNEWMNRGRKLAGVQPSQAPEILTLEVRGFVYVQSGPKSENMHAGIIYLFMYLFIC